jgi:hypothetical protein
VTIYRDQLEAVYKLIEKPERWTKEYFARNANGDGIEESYDSDEDGNDLNDEEIAAHPDAVCWCLYGAAYKCGIDDDRAYAEALLGETGYLEVVTFNDKSTHAEVLQLLKDAIERAPVRP